MLLKLLYLNILLLAPLITSYRLTYQPGISKFTYEKTRESILAAEEARSVGSNLTLSDKELRVNEDLMFWKTKEMDEGFENPAQFPPSRNFLEAKDDIEKSKIFSWLKRMPKGAVFHSYTLSMASVDFLIKNLTYMDNLYAKYNGQNLQEFRFSQNPPSEEWKSLKDIRREVGSTFDDFLRTIFTLTKNDIGLNIDEIWKKFENIFKMLRPITSYEPAWRSYFYQILQEFYEDNVIYLEIRDGFLVKKIDGTSLDERELCQMYTELIDDFKKKNPKFFGLRLIYTAQISEGEKAFNENLQRATNLKRICPDLIAGFDADGREDRIKPLKTFSDGLLGLQNELNFYFRAGETKWSGFHSDQNLIDAVALGTKRIAHGYALTKHPMVAQIVKDRRIGIEICPISNQVLGLVEDLHNHPANHLLTNGYPVVIAPDNPCFWGAKGVSYDWYETFMGLAAKWQDLRLLKQLAINSIQQSSLNISQKAKLCEAWQNDWNLFIDELYSERR